MVPLESVGVVHDKLGSSQEGSSMWSSSSDGDILSQRTPPPGPVIAVSKCWLYVCTGESSHTNSTHSKSVMVIKGCTCIIIMYSVQN